MSILSILLSVSALVIAWLAIGPAWAPLAVAVTAAVIAFAQAVVALGRKDWMHWSLRALVLALVVLMALPTIRSYRSENAAPQIAAQTPLDVPPPDNPSGAVTPFAVIANDPPPPPADDPPAAVARAATLAGKINRANYDLDARVRALPDSVDGVFGFVRDQIGFDSYPGALRGDVGTLHARAGNAWDRALLLSSMLRAKGFNTRFASARLDDEVAGRLFDRMFVRAATAPASDKARPLTDRLKARATRDLTVLRAALSGSLPADSGVTRAMVLDEIRDHAWVQARVDGIWRDMDPSLRDLPAGRPLVEAQQTFDEVPADKWQRVTLRVIVDRLENGVISPSTVLEFESPAAALLGKKIFLAHVPAATGAGGALARMAGQQWRPLLSVDGTAHTGDAIAFGGPSNDSAGGFFFGGGPSAQLTAEWLEIQYDLTAGRTDTTRRALFDRGVRLPVREDEALPPIPMLNEGPVPALALHNIWLTAGRHDLAAYADQVALLTANPPTPEQPRAPDVLIGDIATMNFPYLVWSDHLIVPSVDTAPDVRVYADSPRVLIFSMAPSAGGPGRAEGIYDLHRDRIRAVARDASAAPAAIERKLWFGILEGALEHEMTAAEVGAVGGSAADFLTTSALISERGTTTLRDGAAESIASLAGDPVRADRMRVALARGSQLVVPLPAQGQPARGWWEVSRTGDLRAVIDGDLGGSSYSLGKGTGPVRWGGGYGTPDGRMPRLPRPPAAGGGAAQEYSMLLTLIAFGMIYALEAFIFIIYMRAVQRGISVMEELDRDFGDAEPASP